MKRSNVQSQEAQANDLSSKFGYIQDFITGKLVKSTPEEKVRQSIEHLLVENYGYLKDQMDIEFRIQRGSKKDNEKADIVIFNDVKIKKQILFFS